MGENILVPVHSGKVFLSRVQGHVPDLSMPSQAQPLPPCSQESPSPTAGQTEAIQEWVFYLPWPQE